MKTKHALSLKLVGGLFALALLGAPSLATAVVTITQVDVIVGGQHFCDTTTPCGNSIWNLNGGITLTPGQTLVLTQTGGIPIGANFDTSDRGPTEIGCSTAGGTPCTVQIYVNSGSGLTLVYTNTAGDPLSSFNMEPFSNVSLPGAFPFNESAPWQLAFMGTTYRLDIGYADNVHGNPCPSTGCFPQPVWGSAAGTYVLGAGLTPPFGDCGVTRPPTDSAGHNVGCYDSGALLFTALATGTQGCTPGYWKQSQHFDSWPAAYSTSQKISSVFTVPSALSGLGSMTLLQGLSFQGGPDVNGKAQILLRAAISALLNSAKVDYPLTTAQVISQVNTALASLDRDTILALATTLDNNNNLRCPLN